MTSERRSIILRIISLLAVVAISIWIYSIRDQASELAAFGYPGIFIISILANATVLLPAPGVAVVFTMGGILNPFFLGIVAGIGSAIGELSGYMAGYSGQAVIEIAKFIPKSVLLLRNTAQPRYSFWRRYPTHFLTWVVSLPEH